jgi:uncharacterized protein (TIGR02145 family)
MIESIVPPHQNEVEIGGRWYPYVQIGRQWWLAKNLAYKWDGLSIDIGTSSTYPIAYYVGDDPNNDGLGLLYNWAATYNLNVNRNSLLPEGWRVSNDNDLLRLQQSVGGEDLAGYHLKSKDWPPSDDSAGFNAINAGFMNENGVFIGSASNFWSSDDATYPKLLEINGSKDTGTIFGYHKPAAFLLRLCKDATVNIGGCDYPTTRIGNQIWLAENLNYAWEGLPVGTNYLGENPAATRYTQYGTTYMYYDYAAVKQLEANKNTLLPDGWRVPTRADFITLSNYIGTASKVKTTSNWSNNGNGTDDFKMSILPTGYIFSYDTYPGSLGEYCVLSTVDEREGEHRMYGCAIWGNRTTLDYDNDSNQWAGLSVRLVKDVT